MIEKFKAYWKSRQSNIHSLILFLGGTSGFATLQALGLHDNVTKAVCAGAVLAAAFLFTPDAK